MLTAYSLALLPSGACRPTPEWGYRLYAALLEQLPPQFAHEAHGDDYTPISQFLRIQKDGSLVWHVGLLGHRTEDMLSETLDRIGEIQLEKERVLLTVTDRMRNSVSDVDALLEMASSHSGLHRLRFCTPTAFKSRGEYVNLPASRLILQSLLKKWNGCMSECPIEDEDGEGMESLAAGLRFRTFQLRDRVFHLKGNTIPGFFGEVTIENRLSGFHRQLADALLLFADCSGVGIKTTLGMGGVVHLQ